MAQQKIGDQVDWGNPEVQAMARAAWATIFDILAERELRKRGRPDAPNGQKDLEKVAIQ